jgi:hypothetical protein
LPQTDLRILSVYLGVFAYFYNTISVAHTPHTLLDVMKKRARERSGGGAEYSGGDGLV